MKKIIGKNFGTLVLLPVIFLSSGCGLWRNFTAYFNLYYNASTLFEDAEADILKQKKELFPEQEKTTKSNTSNTNLTKVIEKLSKLLQFDSKSSFVDDALLMIGKSFYYQQDYQKALRKFTELITTFPESKLVLEAQLWSGKTQIKLRNFEQAIQILQDTRKKAAGEDENEILVQAYLEEIGYLISEQNYTAAITEMNELVKVSDDEEINAEVTYELGRLYLKQNNSEMAAKAFADVLNYSPRFEIEYKSKLEYGKIKRELKRPREALDIFRDIRDESNYKEFMDQTDLQIGLAHYDLEQYDQAFEQLTLVDTSYRQSVSSGIAEYHLGHLMEVQYRDFDSAAVYYKRASSAANMPVEYSQLISKKLQSLANYQNYSKQIAQSRQMLIYKENPELFQKDSTDYANEIALRDSLRKMEAKSGGTDKSRRTQDEDRSSDERRGRGRDRNEDEDESRPASSAALTSAIQRPAPVKPTITADSIKTILSKNEYELAGLFFTELNVPDSALYYYEHILQAYPNSPYTARTLYALGSFYQTQNDSLKADSLFNVVYDNYKHDRIINAAANQLKKPLINLDYDPAEELYIAAEKQMDSGKYTEAASGFYALTGKYPKSSFAPKALYASGWILENKLNMPDSAAAVYDTITVKYPASVYSGKVRTKVTFFKTEQARLLKARQDSLNTLMKKDSIAAAQKNAPPADVTNGAKTGDQTQMKDKQAPGDKSGPAAKPGNTNTDTLNTPAVDPVEKPDSANVPASPKFPPVRSDTLNERRR